MTMKFNMIEETWLIAMCNDKFALNYKKRIWEKEREREHVKWIFMEERSSCSSSGSTEVQLGPWTCTLKATSHMRLRARDHYTSSTLIGGNGGVSPSTLHTTLEGPTEYVNARWCKVYMDSYLTSNATSPCFMPHGHLDYLQKPPLGGRPNTKPRDHHGTPNDHHSWFILFYHGWAPAWINIHQNSIWLRAWSHMTSHYTWGSVTTLHDFGGVLGQPLDTFFWALTNSWSRLLACVWSGPKVCGCYSIFIFYILQLLF